MKALEVCELPRLRRLVLPACFYNSFKHLHLQLFLDSDRNHVVICSLILSHQSGHSPLRSRHCAARAFSFTSFTSFASLTSYKSFTIRTSETPLPQPLYNPHLRAPLGSAGNKGLITPLESALTKNSPVSLLESALTKRGGVGVRGTPVRILDPGEVLWTSSTGDAVTGRSSPISFPCHTSEKPPANSNHCHTFKTAFRKSFA